MTHGQVIHQIRKSMGMTQRALSQKLNISQGYLSKVEKDVHDLSLDAFIRLFHLSRDHDRTFLLQQILYKERS